jgi:peptidoglycan/LPS O-acetylase OafA/YrhL
MSYLGQSPFQPLPADRHYGLDWLRIGAFALLMLYHAAMVFVTGDWLVKLAQIEWLSFPMMFLSPWRLAVLFIVAGFASRALLAKLGQPRGFAWERTKRLLVPLLFAMALIIPPQSWVRLTIDHGYTHDYLYYLTHDAFRFGAFDGVTLPGWEHLWFVAYLWAFTMALAVGLARLAPMANVKAALWFEQLGKGSRLLWLPLVYLVPVRAAITFTTGESHGLFDDWLSDLIYLPCFLFGFGLAGSRTLFPALARLWKPALALALASYAVLVAVEIAYPADKTPTHAVMALDRAAMATMLWTMALVMLRLADTALNHDHRWRPTLSEAIFPCYILHQTVIVLVAWWLLPAHLPPALSFAIIVAATALSCLIFYLVGREFAWLRPLIGLRARTKPKLGRRAKTLLRVRPS